MGCCQNNKMNDLSKTPKCCRKCGTRLILDKNFLWSRQKRYDYICHDCNLDQIRNYKSSIDTPVNRRLKKLTQRGKLRCEKSALLPIVKEAEQQKLDTGITHHIDHIIPVGAGGCTCPSNLQVLLPSDHYAKSVTDKVWLWLHKQTFNKKS